MPGANTHFYTPRFVARPTPPRDDPPAAEAADEARSSPPAQEAGIDEILDQLEGVVRQLESGDLPLEQALARFEQGVRLARQGGGLLDAVEERVERLLADRDETVPFDAEDER